ncbi:hypothetical protein FQA39_LY16335 [Lamprigera yunnana]|nr:hypothetical protein FQA39_LY16335 [Lamprigera yunnana]
MNSGYKHLSGAKKRKLSKEKIEKHKKLAKMDAFFRSETESVPSTSGESAEIKVDVSVTSATVKSKQVSFGFGIMDEVWLIIQGYKRLTPNFVSSLTEKRNGPELNELSFLNM